MNSPVTSINDRETERPWPTMSRSVSVKWRSKYDFLFDTDYLKQVHKAKVSFLQSLFENRAHLRSKQISANIPKYIKYNHQIGVIIRSIQNHQTLIHQISAQLSEKTRYIHPLHIRIIQSNLTIEFKAKNFGNRHPLNTVRKA